MRFARALTIAFGLALASGLLDCKKKSNSGSDGGALVPEPGVCHRICCSAADCAPGDTCDPFEPASGSLGVCSSTRPGPDGGTPSGDAGNPPDASGESGPPPVDAGTGAGGDAGVNDGGMFDAGSLLPYTCWSASDPICDPMSNAPCDALGEVCDVGSLTDGGYDLFCFDGPSNVQPGKSCDNALGPWCLPGYHCVATGDGG